MIASSHKPRVAITEAIIDLRVEPPDGLTLADLELCDGGEEKAYPTKISLNREGGHLQVGSSRGEQIGFLFKSADEKQLFQTHREGFTMNRLAPYPGWEPFRDEARRLWNVYRERARPRRVVRLAVRYLSRLDLPGLGAELKQYLKVWPELSAGLPQPPESFFMQVTIPQTDLGGTLRLTEAAVPPQGPDTAAVILDIDLFRTDKLPPDEERLWGLVEDLRRRNHEVFEACVTEKTREGIG